jgi:hypothetical protein
MITREPGSFSRRRSTALRRLGGWVLAPALLGLALTGCTSAPSETASPTATSEVTSAAPSGTSSGSPSASTSASATASAAATEAASEVTIDITIAKGQVNPNGKKLDIRVGQQIVLNVTSDEDDEIHAHTPGDGYELEVGAGKKVTGSFTITSPGSYEVESHHLEKTIVILNAR